MSSKTQKLFVYGTLRRGFSLHRYLRNGGVRFLGKGKIRGRLYDLGEYPGARPSVTTADQIEGELYELSEPERQLRELDEIEEFRPEEPTRSLFIRRMVDVHFPAGRRCRAWAYFLSRKPAEANLIRRGDYAFARPSLRRIRAGR